MWYPVRRSGEGIQEIKVRELDKVWPIEKFREEEGKKEKGEKERE